MNDALPFEQRPTVSCEEMEPSAKDDNTICRGDYIIGIRRVLSDE